MRGAAVHHVDLPIHEVALKARAHAKSGEGER